MESRFLSMILIVLVAVLSVVNLAYAEDEKKQENREGELPAFKITTTQPLTTQKK